jgi:hypothetical protein
MLFVLGLVLAGLVLWWGHGNESKPSNQREAETCVPPFSSGLTATVPPSATNLSDVPPPVPGTPHSTNGDLAEFLNMAKNPAIATDEREDRIMALGRQSGAEATRKLMALGNEDTYLNFAALKALGTVKSPEVATYLETKLTNGDPRMVAAAVMSLASVKGEAAIAQIAGVLNKNRLREDGHQDIVCGACVTALTDLHASSALPTLVLELEKTVGVTLHHEYGSRVVAAIREIGNPAGVEALRAYTERLRALKSQQTGNPKGEQYFQSKLDEVASTIIRLQSGQ